MCEQRLFYNSVVRWLQRYIKKFKCEMEIHDFNDGFDQIECYFEDKEAAQQFYDSIWKEEETPWNFADNYLDSPDDECWSMRVAWCDDEPGDITYGVELLVLIKDNEIVV